MVITYELSPLPTKRFSMDRKTHFLINVVICIQAKIWLIKISLKSKKWPNIHVLCDNGNMPFCFKDYKSYCFLHHKKKATKLFINFDHCAYIVFT